MNEILKNIPTSGIITPGDIYIVSSNDRGFDPGPTEFLYILTRDEDILTALELELCIVLGDMYDLRMFISSGRVEDGSHEFRFLCREKGRNEEVKHSIFLHRLSTLSEQLTWAKTCLTDSR